MSFDWQEYLGLALHLQGQQGNATQEASLRSSVSRAYYAAYCYARNHARDQLGFIPTNSAKDHYRLRKHFIKYKEVGIANRLDILRQWRNDCDYNDVVSNISKLCSNTIKEAKKVIGKFT